MALAVAGWLAAFVQQDEYVASTLVSVADLSFLRGDADVRGLNYIRTEASVIESDTVLDRAATSAAAELSQGLGVYSIRATPSSTRREIRVTVVARDSQVPVELVGAVVRAYQTSRQSAISDAVAEIETTRADSREAILEALAALDADEGDPVATVELRTLSDRLLALDIRSDVLAERTAAVGSGIEVLEEVKSPTRRGPNDIIPIAVGAVLGLLLGLSISLWGDGRSRRV